MKRFVTCMLTLTMLLALAVTAQADVLWEPDNNFYRQHREDCTYVGRSFYANGSEGFITIWNAPEGSLAVKQFENGFKLHVYWLYEDWGCVDVHTDEGWVEGWVPMGDLQLIYDHISFAEEYADEIKPYNGEFANFDDDSATVNFYAYPGAPTVSFSQYMFEHNTMENLTGTTDTPSYIQSVFVDEEGLTWGYIGYMYGSRNIWFCLDNPGGLNDETSTDFPIRQTNTPELIPAQEPVWSIKAYIPYLTSYLVVGAVVVVTVGLLTVLSKKKKA